MASGQDKGKTTALGAESIVKGKYSPECYLHPGSATLLFTEPAETKILEQEHEFLSGLLEAQMMAQTQLDDINFEAIAQAGKAPARRFESEITQAYVALNKANQALRKELMSLTANPPEGVLLDEKMKDNAIGIMELLPLKNNSVQGFKKTYVRSDKIKNHSRKYKLSEVDKKTGEASFIKYKEKRIETTDSNGKPITKTIRQGKIDVKELKKQLSEVPASFKFDLIEDSNVIVTHWAEEMNKSLTWPKGETKFDESVYHQYVDISAQAQLMRYSHGAGASAKFNPAAEKIEGKLEGHASFALGEAKGETTLYLPDRLGVSLLFPAREVTRETPDGICNMGALRFAMKMVLSGSVGASIAIEVGAEVDWSGDMGKGYGVKGRPVALTAAPGPGQRKIDLTHDMAEAQGGAEIGAFIGVQAGGNISGAIEWFDPHPDKVTASKDEKHGSKPITDKEKKFATIAKLEVGAILQAGAGGGGVFYITYVQGRFRIYCKAAFCWGVGAKGDIGFEVDGSNFSAFIKSFMYMLRNVDYQKLEKMMAEDAFGVLCAIPLIMAAKGVQAGAVMIGEVVDIIFALGEALKQESKRVSLMNSIIDNPDQLKYTPPETKGAVIAQLMDITWVDKNDPRNQNHNPLTINYWKTGPMKLRKQAIFKALKWVQSQADYDNVMQHVSKIPGTAKIDRDAGEQMVTRFLSIGEYDFLFFTNYGEKILDLYNNLPASVAPDAPFVPIPDTLMDSYLAMVGQQAVFEPGNIDDRTMPA